MLSNEMNLLAAIADAEILRHQLAAAEALLSAERRRIEDLLRQVAQLGQRGEAAEERQRELQVLLLHRDEEIARLHGYLQSAWKPGAAEPGAGLPILPEPESQPVRQRVTTEERLVARLASDVVTARQWLGRVIGLARREQ